MNVSFHRLPSDIVDGCSHVTQEHAEPGRVCSEHLAEDDFVKTADSRTTGRFKWHEQMF